MQTTLFKDGTLYEAGDFHVYYESHLTDGYLRTKTPKSLTVTASKVYIQNIAFMIDGAFYSSGTDTVEIGTLTTPTQAGFYLAHAVIAYHNKQTDQMGVRVKSSTLSSSADTAIASLKDSAVHTATDMEYVVGFYVTEKDMTPVFTGYATADTATYPMIDAQPKTKTTAKSAFLQKLQTAGEQMVQQGIQAKDTALTLFERLGVESVCYTPETVTVDGSDYNSATLPSDAIDGYLLAYLNGRLTDSTVYTATVDGQTVKYIKPACGQTDSMTIRYFRNKTGQ